MSPSPMLVQAKRPFVPIEVEVLEVHLGDAGPERADPVLRVAVEHDVADVEVRLQPWRVELVDVAGELQRAQEELVPDLLDGDDHLQLARQRQQPLSNHALRTRPRVLVRRRRVDDGRHQQHGIGAPQRRVAQRRLHAGDAAGARRHDRGSTAGIASGPSSSPSESAARSSWRRRGSPPPPPRARSSAFRWRRSRRPAPSRSAARRAILRQHGNEDGLAAPAAGRSDDRPWRYPRRNGRRDSSLPMPIDARQGAAVEAAPQRGGRERLQKYAAIHHTSPARRRSFR